jgi:hypothetical protein
MLTVDLADLAPCRPAVSRSRLGILTLPALAELMGSSRVCPRKARLMNESEKIVLVEGARTPIGSFGAAFKDVAAHGLAALFRRVG